MPDSLPDLSAEELDRVAGAAADDGLMSDSLESPATNDSTAQTVGTPDGAGQTDGATSTEDSFTRIDPSTLPPELQPIYRSLQGDYTRKTQEAAPWRTLGEELGVSSPDEIRQAAELYTYLQDPANLTDFAQRLNAQLGIDPGAPGAVAGQPDPYGMDDLEEDSPVRQLQSRIDSLESQLQGRQQQDAAERMQWALVGEIQREEALLAQENPHYTDEDWDAIYGLAPAFEGDLIQTRNALEEFASHRLAQYLGQKTGVAANPGFQAPPRPVSAEVPRDVSTEAADDPDLRGAGREALEYLRGVLSQSE